MFHQVLWCCCNGRKASCRITIHIIGPLLAQYPMKETWTIPHRVRWWKRKGKKQQSTDRVVECSSIFVFSFGLWFHWYWAHLWIGNGYISTKCPWCPTGLSLGEYQWARPCWGPDLAVSHTRQQSTRLHKRKFEKRNPTNTDKIDEAVSATVVFPKNIRRTSLLKVPLCETTTRCVIKRMMEKKTEETTIHGSSCWMFFNNCFLVWFVHAFVNW